RQARARRHRPGDASRDASRHPRTIRPHGLRSLRNFCPRPSVMTSVRPDLRHLAVVPAYNEAATVGDVVRRVHADAPEWDVVVIDDGSTDATVEVAKAAGARVVRLPFNLGIGGAVQAGFVFAR